MQDLQNMKIATRYFFGDNDAPAYASYFSNWSWSRKGFILKDGMLVSEVYFDANNASEIGSTYHKYTIFPYVFFDTNGPTKGPNRFGYDLFYFINMTCHFTSCDPLNDSVKGCYLSARKDQNPYDSSVSYWKSLYKPKSYWEKLKNK